MGSLFSMSVSEQGSHDEATSLMQVFADTDASIAREWAERVYASVREDSEPLKERADPTY